jgi:hypothetical protein
MDFEKPGQMDSVNLAKIEKMIFVIRGQKVMLDSDLAELYEVETKVLNQAVRRNIDRFPADFMFELSPEEHDSLRSQTVTLKNARGKHRKYRPLVFTEQGVAMLSGVLTSSKAINMNIAIMRTFVKVRQLLFQESLSHRVTELEKGTDKIFKIVFARLDNLERNTPVLPHKRRKIGI